MNLILLGAPGAGKGTQAQVLARELSLPHVASGDLFREAIAKNTQLGLAAKFYMDRGELVPDEVVIKMILERIQQPDCRKGFILDGFPRTVQQAEALGRALAERGSAIDGVLYIRVSTEELLRRLSGRFICHVCQAPYHMVSGPPKRPNICDKCGGELYQREDDRREVAENRLQVYFAQTEPVIGYYANRGLLHEINGEQSVEAVTRELLETVKAMAEAGS